MEYLSIIYNAIGTVLKEKRERKKIRFYLTFELN